MPIKTLTMRLAVPVRGYNSRMEVVLNGESCRDCVGLTVDQLLEREGFNGRRIAVEINRKSFREADTINTSFAPATKSRLSMPSAAAEPRPIACVLVLKPVDA